MALQAYRVDFVRPYQAWQLNFSHASSCKAIVSVLPIAHCRLHVCSEMLYKDACVCYYSHCH